MHIDDSGHLKQISRWKQLPQAAITIGELVQRPGSIEQQQKQQQRMQELQAALERVAGDRFRSHCRVLGFQRGLLTIGLDDPAIVYIFRRERLFALREELARSFSDVVVHIRFEVESFARC